MKKHFILVALVSSQALAHSQVPVKYETKVYTDSKSFSFDVTNKNEFPTGFDVSVGDIDLDTREITNEEIKGEIRIVQPNQRHTFRMRLTAERGTTTNKVVCTSANNPDVSYKSKICSLVSMTRR